MSGNSNNAGPSKQPAPQKKRGNPSWRRYYRPNVPREKPTAFQINSGNATPSSSSCAAPQQKPTSIFLNTKNDDCPIWHLYFPEENFNKTSPTVQKAKSFEVHFDSHPNTYNLMEIASQFWFTLNLQFVLSDNRFKSTWNNFQQNLIENPEMVLACAGMSMHKLIINHLDTTQERLSAVKNANSLLKTIRPRLHGFGPIVSLKSLRATNYDKLIAIRGTVIRAGPSEILCIWLAFKCPICTTEQVVRQPEGIYTIPTSCKGQCRARSNFVPLLSSPYTRTIAYQTIRVQESRIDGQFDPGKVPKNIEVELLEDLVDLAFPGDDITLTGILKVKPEDETQRKGQASVYKMYIRAVAIFSNKNAMSNKKSEFTEKDMQAIEMIRKEPSRFRFLVQSLCPMIYGHEMVKAGLLLGLFGASGSHREKRAEIHVLVVGDPGVGKSQMLQSCASVSPRGIFICGSSSSNTGLTVTVRQERGCIGTGESLEAGVLVLADEGVCCIDEFDKMSSHRQSLLEVMEQQTVSVAKAGVLCTLPARTCILAAANPIGGHYDRSKTVSENLKMSPALLSRFDLVFILLDRPNPRLDNLLMSHIQALHCGEKKLNSNWDYSNHANTSESGYNSTINAEKQSLEERLKLSPNEELDLLPAVLLQKYIAYARKNCHPRLTPEAAEQLRKFYLELRTVRPGVDTIPVTIRQLEGFIRLTQARARLELSSEATLEHALDILSIVRHSLVDVFSTDGGELQMQRNINGSGMSQLNQAKKFIQALKIRSSALNKTIFDQNELKKIAMYAGLTANISQLIDSLNVQGILLKKGNNIYKFYAE